MTHRLMAGVALWLKQQFSTHDPMHIEQLVHAAHLDLELKR